VGGTVQEVLQRRGSEKGYGVRIKRALLPSLLLLSYAGIILTIPSARPLAWFLFTLVPAALYSYLCFVRRRKNYTFEALSSYGLLMAGGIQSLNLNWLHLVYIPYLMFLCPVYGPGVVIPLSVTVPLLEIRHFMEGNLLEEAVFSCLTILTTTAFSMVFLRIRREKGRMKESLAAFEEEVQDMGMISSVDQGNVEEVTEDTDAAAGVDLIGSDNLLSQHRLMTEKANREIGAVLFIAKDVLPAEMVSMFVLRDNSLRLRCSTDQSRIWSAAEERLIMACIQKRQSGLCNVSPARSGQAFSHLATPLIDGNFVNGALVISRSGQETFRTAEAKITELFSRQIVSILQMQRIHFELQREQLMFRKLEVGSKKLISSLRTYDIANSLLEVVSKIAPQKKVSMGLFVPKGEKLEVVRQIGFTVSEGSSLDFRETLVGSVARMGSGNYYYVSDLSQKGEGPGIPVLPFMTADEGSLFVLPLWYEKDLTGILVYFTPKINALRIHQIQLLEVLANLVSLSLVNARFHAEIERMAVTDGLTGLFNHRTFQEKLSGEFRRMQRLAGPLSLLLIDIDFFKKINDAYGHPAGDEVLRGIAAVIRETIRNIDIPARYGGEEFAAILLGTNHEGARKMAERLRKTISEKTFSLDGKEVVVTVSIGAATSPYDTGGREELVEKADQALYHAKRSGRNRCVLWSEIK
jgi:diguanylate cyclase (GGDEF)-like protein